MRNLALLQFLAGVQQHCDSSATLMAATGYDPLELQVAVAIAGEAGFTEPTGEIHPCLRLTAAGRAWAAAELAPFADLVARSDVSARAV